MYGDSKAITSSKERKKFECQETTGSRSRPLTRALTFITNKTKKPLEDKCEKKKQKFYSKNDCFRHNSIPYKPRRTLQTEKSKEKNNKASVRLLSCLRNFWKFKGRSSSKRKEHQNFIPFYVLLSFLVCINTDSKVQTGATLFKTALKVELFSCFDGRPTTRARKKIIAFKMNE